MQPFNEHAPGLGGKTLGKIKRVELQWIKAGIKKAKSAPLQSKVAK